MKLHSPPRDQRPTLYSGTMSLSDACAVFARNIIRGLIEKCWGRTIAEITKNKIKHRFRVDRFRYGVNISISIYDDCQLSFVILNDFPPAYFHFQCTSAHFFETVYGLGVRHPVDRFVVYAQYLVTCEHISDQMFKECMINKIT